MEEQKNRPYLICLTGLTGCGKTTTKNMFASYAEVVTFYTKELHKAVFGQQVEVVDKMDISTLLPQKSDFIRRIMTHISKIRRTASVVVLDSIRSTGELEYIKNLSDYRSVFLVHVTCEGQKRIERLKKRDNCTEENIQVRDLIDVGKDGSHMFNMDVLFKKADFVIDTSGSFDDVQGQVFVILSRVIEHPRRNNLFSKILECEQNIRS